MTQITVSISKVERTKHEVSQLEQLLRDCEINVSETPVPMSSDASLYPTGAPSIRDVAVYLYSQGVTAPYFSACVQEEITDTDEMIALLQDVPKEYMLAAIDAGFSPREVKSVHNLPRNHRINNIVWHVGKIGIAEFEYLKEAGITTLEGISRLRDNYMTPEQAAACALPSLKGDVEKIAAFYRSLRISWVSERKDCSRYPSPHEMQALRNKLNDDPERIVQDFKTYLNENHQIVCD